MVMDPELNFDWPLPALSDVADLPLAFRRFADTLADDLTTSGKMSYTPQWVTVAGGAVAGSPNTQPGGGVTRSGVYSSEKFSGICHITITLLFTSGVYGAYGSLGVVLPVPGVADIRQQMMPCFLYVPSTGTVWNGQTTVDAGSFISRPHFPISNTRAAEQLPWASVSSAFTGSSIPIVNPGNTQQSNIEAGGYLVISGSYRFA